VSGVLQECVASPSQIDGTCGEEVVGSGGGATDTKSMMMREEVERTDGEMRVWVKRLRGEAVVTGEECMRRDRARPWSFIAVHYPRSLLASCSAPDP
jgi:hypothetical protein